MNKSTQQQAMIPVVDDIDELDLDDDIARRHAEAARLEQDERTRARAEEARLEKLRTAIVGTGLDGGVADRLVREQLQAEQDQRDEAERAIDEVKRAAVLAERKKQIAASRGKFDKLKAAHIEAVERACAEVYARFAALRALECDGFCLTGEESTLATSIAFGKARKTVDHDVAWHLGDAFAQSRWH